MEARGWPLERAALERLETLLDLWVRYGAVMNLSGARTRRELLPHVIDGLDTAWLVREVIGLGPGVRWLDLGSGGGFPALVVAAVGDCSMMLLEPRQKRSSFLELALRSIGRGSIAVQTARFDRATWGQEAANGFIGVVEGGVRVVSARAVWAPQEWLEVAHHVLGNDGHVVVHFSDAISAKNLGVRRSVTSARGEIGLVQISAGGSTR